MTAGWLWDKKTTEAEARNILKNPDSDRFIIFAALLLARINDPREVFKHYIAPIIFCRKWPLIKQQMRRDRWTGDRITYWQAVYERLIDKYRKKRIVFRKEKKFVREPICGEVGRRIHAMRKEQGLSQKDFAKKIKVSQQLISRVEKGGENVSLITLANIARALDKKVEINFI